VASAAFGDDAAAYAVILLMRGIVLLVSLALLGLVFRAIRRSADTAITETADRVEERLRERHGVPPSPGKRLFVVDPDGSTEVRREGDKQK